MTMNASRLASLSAALVAVALVTAGCASKRDDSAMRSAPMTPVAAAPVVQQPAPVVVEARAPSPMATAPAAPVVTAMPPTVVASSQNSNMSDNRFSERAPRADRN